jgi:hypothetical protein
MKKLTKSFCISAIATAMVFLHPAPGQAGQVPLASTWNGFDPHGLLVLSGQSASGFTAQITTNSFGDGNVGVPRVFQTFADVPFANQGSRVTVEFDVIFNNATVLGDNQFRFGVACTNNNEFVMSTVDIGTTLASGSTAINSRFGSVKSFGITYTTNSNGSYQNIYNPANWNRFGNSGLNMTAYVTNAATVYPATDCYIGPGPNGPVSGGANNYVPNGAEMGFAGQLSVIHHFRYSVERVNNGLGIPEILQDCIWSNNNPTNSLYPLYLGTSAFYNDTQGSTNTVPTWQQINGFGFHIFNNGAFGVGGTGSYTISNVVLRTGFNITSVQQDPVNGDIVTWESSPYDYFTCAYNVLYTTNLASGNWVTNTTLVTPSSGSYANHITGFWTTYTNASPVDAERFYRIQQVFNY